jgi:hypothetical protein
VHDFRMNSRNMEATLQAFGLENGARGHEARRVKMALSIKGRATTSPVGVSYASFWRTICRSDPPKTRGSRA